MYQCHWSKKKPSHENQSCMLITHLTLTLQDPRRCYSGGSFTMPRPPFDLRVHTNIAPRGLQLQFTASLSPLSGQASHSYTCICKAESFSALFAEKESFSGISETPCFCFKACHSSLKWKVRVMCLTAMNNTPIFSFNLPKIRLDSPPPAYLKWTKDSGFPKIRLDSPPPLSLVNKDNGFPRTLWGIPKKVNVAFSNLLLYVFHWLYCGVPGPPCLSKMKSCHSILCYC